MTRYRLLFIIFLFSYAISVALTALALLGFSLSQNYAQLCLLAIPFGLGAGAIKE